MILLPGEQYHIQFNDLSVLALCMSSHNLKNEFWLKTHSVESNKDKVRRNINGLLKVESSFTSQTFPMIYLPLFS